MASDETRLLARNPWVTRRPITVAEYRRMGEVGILTEDDQVELIDGELVAMLPTGSGHSATNLDDPERPWRGSFRDTVHFSPVSLFHSFT